MRTRALAVAAVCVATVGTVVLPTAPTLAAAPAAPAPIFDFNGDGYPDLASSADSATINGVAGAGALAVVYGSATGLRYDAASIISQATPGVPGDPTPQGSWGVFDGAGDLNGDGYDDLVVHPLNPARTKYVLWGSKNGITGAGTVLPAGNRTPNSPWLYTAQPIAFGDVNGDHVDDIVAAGNIGGGPGLTVLLGPLDRTTGASADVWFRDTRTLDNVAPNITFVGDTTGDRKADIAVSAIDRGDGRTGGVVLKGSTTGLIKGGSFDAPNMDPGTMNAQWPVAAYGDLNRDGYPDLVAGYRKLNKVYVAYGGPDGVSTTIPARSYDQDSPGVPGSTEMRDQFGTAVAIGDTDRDGYADLIIGAPSETGSDPAAAESGSITVLRGSAAGITTTGAKSFTQNAKDVPSTSEYHDWFGWSLAVTDTDRNGKPEVYVGGFGEDTGRGRIWVLPTGTSGVTGIGSTSFHLGTLGGPPGGRISRYLAG
ncbi:FG-GAP and VCBS repeat-containing protein [Actinoplanes sp. NPDC051475]|uniref:FG-GAP and VCBS repeat-containing protein n=1 Tax=Actinoplanes sp. NPDC051475 TaxID=3157225 RepID=UPI00344D9125